MPPLKTYIYFNTMLNVKLEVKAYSQEQANIIVNDLVIANLTIDPNNPE